MRVVAGEARGRRLQTPPGNATRPTLDRVREATFNALGSLDAVDGARVLDLFAGSGALGIEALSRGAAHCTFVERAAPARRAIVANLEATGLVDRADVLAADALAHVERLAGRPDAQVPSGAAPATASSEAAGVDLVLLDPPYDTDDDAWARLLGAVRVLLLAGVAADGEGPGHVVVESDRSVLPDRGWNVLRAKTYGDTLVVIAQPSNPMPEPS